MADIINTVGPGQTYETINLWWSAKPNTADRWVGQYIGTGSISITSLLDTNDNGGAYLYADAPYNFNSPTDAHVTITASSGFSIDIGAGDKFVIEGFEIENTMVSPTDSDNPIGINGNFSQDIEILKCRIKGGASALKGTSSSGSVYYFENCHISGSDRAGLWARTSPLNTSHCVIEGCNTTITSFHGGIIEVAGNVNDSTVCYGNGSRDFRNASATDINCASGDTTAHGAGAVTGVTTADFDNTAADIWTSKAGGLLSGSGSGGTDIGLSLIAADVIMVVSPSQGYFFGRDKATNTQGIVVSGGYSGITVPTAIEASFNGGPFVTIDASPSAGTYSGVLPSQPVGNGGLVVRFTNDTGVSTTQPDIAIGAKFLAWGQSNFSGRATNAQIYAGTTGFFHKYTVTNDVWELGADPFDTATSSGSVFPLIANHLVNNKSIPVGFIGVAQGSTALSSWQSGQALNTRMLDYITNSGGGDIEGVISWIGETDADTGTIEATFKSQYNSVVDQLEVLTGAKSVICGIAQSNGSSVNTWMQDIKSSNNNISSYVDIASLFTGVHYTTDQQTSDSALAIYNQMNSAFFSSIFNITVTGIPDGSYMTVLDQDDGTRIQRQNETYTGEALSILIPVDVGTIVKGYVDDSLDPSSDAAYIEGTTV